VAAISRSDSQPERARRGIAFRIFGLACIALVAWGGHVRDEHYVSADFGLGYALGIIGLSAMLLLLLYSVRKRLRAISGWGPLRHWFGIHMALGILGPVAILFHANFRMGSLNSSVALVCMLLVAASGVVGRLIYPKIHHGLYGRRASLRALERAAASQRDALGGAVAAFPALAHALAEFDALARQEAGGPFSAMARATRLGGRARALRRLAPPGRQAESTRRSLADYVAAVRQVAGFSVYERIFALWHAFHLPLCFLLFAAAFVHVIAAHLY
jgi:hypothetical protein